MRAGQVWGIQECFQSVLRWVKLWLPLATGHTLQLLSSGAERGQVRHEWFSRKVFASRLVSVSSHKGKCIKVSAEVTHDTLGNAGAGMTELRRSCHKGTYPIPQKELLSGDGSPARRSRNRPVMGTYSNAINRQTHHDGCDKAN
jgi:hypothetical protein